MIFHRFLYFYQRKPLSSQMGSLLQARVAGPKWQKNPGAISRQMSRGRRRFNVVSLFFVSWYFAHVWHFEDPLSRLHHIKLGDFTLTSISARLRVIRECVLPSLFFQCRVTPKAADSTFAPAQFEKGRDSACGRGKSRRIQGSVQGQRSQASNQK